MIRDRGLMKWQGMMLPEHVEMLRELDIDLNRERKPLLDEYQIQEFEEKLHYAIAFNYPVKLSVWQEGFTHELEVHVHYIDSLKKQIRALDKEECHRIDFGDIVGVEVLD